MNRHYPRTADSIKQNYLGMCGKELSVFGISRLQGGKWANSRYASSPPTLLKPVFRGSLRNELLIFGSFLPSVKNGTVWLLFADVSELLRCVSQRLAGIHK